MTVSEPLNWSQLFSSKLWIIQKRENYLVVTLCLGILSPVQWIPLVSHYDGQHCSWVFFIHLLFQALVELKIWDQECPDQPERNNGYKCPAGKGKFKAHSYRRTIILINVESRSTFGYLRMKMSIFILVKQVKLFWKFYPEVALTATDWQLTWLESQTAGSRSVGPGDAFPSSLTEFLSQLTNPIINAMCCHSLFRDCSVQLLMKVMLPADVCVSRKQSVTK